MGGCGTDKVGEEGGESSWMGLHRVHPHDPYPYFTDIFSYSLMNSRSFTKNDHASLFSLTQREKTVVSCVQYAAVLASWM